MSQFSDLVVAVCCGKCGVRPYDLKGHHFERREGSCWKGIQNPFLAIYMCDALNMPFNVVFAVKFVILHLAYGLNVNMCLHTLLPSMLGGVTPASVIREILGEGRWTLCQNYNAASQRHTR